MYMLLRNEIIWKKIAITKNGYDVLRIIEGNSGGDKCELKIVS